MANEWALHNEDGPQISGKNENEVRELLKANEDDGQTGVWAQNIAGDRIETSGGPIISV
jgi:hypothetical protein